MLLAMSQQAGARELNNDLFSLSLEELANITITGSTLTEKRLRDVPASVTVYTASDIQKLPVRTVEDLMNYVPGMQTYRSSDFSSADTSSIRGRRATTSNVEMLVLLNGMKIDNYAVGGSMLSFPNIPLDNVSRIEFIRGPGSAVYGSNAFTGVINIITQNNRNTARLEGGTPGNANASLQQTWQAQNLEVQLFASAEHEKGERYWVSDPATNQMTSVHDPQYRGNLQLQMTIGDSTHVQWVYARNHADGFYVGGTIDESFNNYNIAYQGAQLTQDLHWHQDIDSQIQLGTQYSTLEVDNRPITAIPIGTISSPPSAAPLLTKAEFTSAEYSFNWNNDWHLSEDSSLQFGLEYRNPQLKKGISRGNYDLNQIFQQQLPVNYYGDFTHATQILKNASADIAGLYSQYQRQFNDRWETIIGARYDHYSQIGGHFSPRLGLITHASARDSFKLLYGEAFRAPQAVERFNTNNSTVVGNPNLEPETVSTWELIWLREMNSSHLVLNYFYNVFKHAISQEPIGLQREYMNSSQRDHSDGIELEWLSRFRDAWQLQVTATHLMDVPTSFYHEARTLMSAAISYQQTSWYGSVTAQYRGSRRTVVQDDGTLKKLDAYWLLAGKAGYRWTPSLETYGEILNATNEDYLTPASTIIADGIPNRGRELRLGFNWQY